MKKGKWNYTEDIEYRVIIVRLHKVDDPPMHWQNAFIGQERQVVEINYQTHGVQKAFFIDNQDGSGLLKISKRGGPDSYHASVAGNEFIRELPEEQWQQFDKDLYLQGRAASEQWQKINFPESYAKVQRMKEAWEKSPYNRKNIK